MKSLVGSISMPSPNIDKLLPSTSSSSSEDSDIHYINCDTVLNSNKNKMNISMRNSFNDTDIDVSTTVINNIKSYITPEKCTADRGMSNYIF